MTRYNGAVVYQIKESDMELAMDNLQTLANAKEIGLINDWGLNQSSLEDVFINVIQSKKDGGEEGVSLE